jgi:hypothetical protein
MGMRDFFQANFHALQSAVRKIVRKLGFVPDEDCVQEAIGMAWSRLRGEDNAASWESRRLWRVLWSASRDAAQGRGLCRDRDYIDAFWREDSWRRRQLEARAEIRKLVLR